MKQPLPLIDRAQPVVYETDRRWVLVLRTWMAPAFMCVVAAVHAYQFAEVNRSSWGAGCGFGMFCTVDYHQNRFVRFLAETDQGVHPMDLKGEWDDLDYRVRVMPTDEQLSQWALEISRCNWEFSEEENDALKLTLIERASSTRKSAKIHKITAQVLGMTLDAHNKKIGTYLINSISMCPKGL